VSAPTIRRCLAIDLATRTCGWAATGADGKLTAFDAWTLPGMADLGRLYAALRNTLADAIEVHRPERLVFAPALFRDAQTAARALLGLVAVTELTAFDYSVEALEIAESTARKAILGRGSFGERDARGKVIKGTGTAATKAAAMAWCEARGWHPPTHDTADAIVLWSYDRLFQASRQPTASFR
jgi:Holliday junction resolvasome RuvABC endonuclease subunit